MQEKSLDSYALYTEKVIWHVKIIGALRYRKDFVRQWRRYCKEDWQSLLKKISSKFSKSQVSDRQNLCLERDFADILCTYNIYS